MRLVATAVALGLASTTAFADPPGMAPPLKPAPKEALIESYRAQTAIADGFALLIVVAAHDTSTFGEAGFGLYLLGAPIVHLTHRRPGRAIGSLAMRAGIPLTAALLLASSHKSSCSINDVQCDDLSALPRVVIGVVAGALLASVLDTAFLAKGDDPPAHSWGPTVAPSHGGVTLGIGGSF